MKFTPGQRVRIHGTSVYGYVSSDDGEKLTVLSDGGTVFVIEREAWETYP